MIHIEERQVPSFFVFLKWGCHFSMVVLEHLLDEGEKELFHHQFKIVSQWWDSFQSLSLVVRCLEWQRSYPDVALILLSALFHCLQEWDVIDGWDHFVIILCLLKHCGMFLRREHPRIIVCLYRMNSLWLARYQLSPIPGRVSGRSIMRAVHFLVHFVDCNNAPSEEKNDGIWFWALGWGEPLT